MDILRGFLLILFRKARPRTLLIWAVILLAIPLLFSFGSTALVAMGRLVPEGAAQMDQAFAEVEAGYVADLTRAYRVSASGSYGEITGQRISDYSILGLISFWALGFNVLALFLIGVYFDKRQIFQDLAAHRPSFRKLLIWGLLIGIPANALYATLIMGLPRFEPSWALTLATVAQGIGAPLFSLAYLSALALLAGTPAWGRRLQVLAPVGQMALTNDLLQILVSNWWMKRFRYGLTEWLWRSLTYLKRQPIRRVT